MISEKINKKRLSNLSKKSEVKTYIKKIFKKINNKEMINIENDFKKISSKLDKIAGKNIIHKNKAARYKKRIYKKIKNNLLK